MKNEKLGQVDDTDYKQIAFKLQSDIEFKIWEETEKNLKFLKEMRLHAKKAFDNRDAASREMLFKMIDDWIDELTQENE